MTFLFLAGSFVYKLSLINTACFLSFKFSAHVYEIETQEPGLRDLGTIQMVTGTLVVHSKNDTLHNSQVNLVVVFQDDLIIRYIRKTIIFYLYITRSSSVQ